MGRVGSGGDWVLGGRGREGEPRAHSKRANRYFNLGIQNTNLRDSNRPALTNGLG